MEFVGAYHNCQIAPKNFSMAFMNFTLTQPSTSARTWLMFSEKITSSKEGRRGRTNIDGKFMTNSMREALIFLCLSPTSSSSILIGSSLHHHGAILPAGSFECYVTTGADFPDQALMSFF